MITVAACLTLWAAIAVPAQGRAPRPSVSASFPAAIGTGSVLRVKGVAKHAGARPLLRLEQRDGSRWSGLVAVRADSRGRYRLSWRPPPQLVVRLLRVVNLRGRAVAGASPSRRVSVRWSEAPVPAGWAGMNVAVDGPAHLDSSGGEWDRMAGAGVESARVPFVWAALQVYETYTAPGFANRHLSDFTTGVGGVPTDFTVTDGIVRAAAARGVRLLPVVLGAPQWAAAPGRRDGTMAIPRDPGEYANYLRTLIRRYGPEGTFWTENPLLPRHPIRQWQVWNEPNIAPFWAGDSKTWRDGYVRLLKAAHDAIKEEDPGADVVLAGLSDYSGANSATALEAIYNNGVYRQETMRSSFDFAAVHPYTLLPKNVVRAVSSFRAEMDGNFDANKPLMITELAWPSSKLPGGRDRASAGGGFNVTEADQARNVREVYPLLAQSREALGLANVFWYTWSASEIGGTTPFNFAGLNADGSRGSRPKPAFAAWSDTVHQLEGCRPTSKTDAPPCR
jgi:hypothetical protein